MNPATPAILQVASAAAWCLLLWKVQLVSYPLFEKIPPAIWKTWHREHCLRIAWIVGPLFVADGLLAFWSGFLSFASMPLFQSLSIATFLGGGLLTAFLFAPLHRRLADSIPAPAELRRLTRLNGLRTALASLRLASALACALASGA